MTPSLPRELVALVSDVGRHLRPAHAEALAVALAAHAGPGTADGVERTIAAPVFVEQARRLLRGWHDHADVPGHLLGAAIVAAARAHDDARRSPHLELVMSGPDTRFVHPRRTEQVLLSLLDEARREVLLVTYALWMYDDLRESLRAALDRGVAITVLAEDPLDDGSFRGDPLRAVAGLAVRRLRWHADRRPEGGAALHAKFVVVDRRTAFVTSANLTRRASGDNLEAGLLIDGGDVPDRLVRHLDELRHRGDVVDAGS